MKLRWLLLAAGVVCLLGVAPASVLSQGPTVEAGCGSATIDGIMSPGEWDAAGRVPLVGYEPLEGALLQQQYSLNGWGYLMNDATHLYVAANVSVDSIVVDPGFWTSGMTVSFTDEGDPLDDQWAAPDCDPVPHEGWANAYEVHVGTFEYLWSGFLPAAETGLGYGCLPWQVPLSGVEWDVGLGSFVHEWALDLNSSELDKVGPGDSLRLAIDVTMHNACVSGTGCTNQGGGTWINEALAQWPEGLEGSEKPDAFGTLRLNPCQEEFVPKPGSIMLLGGGLVALAGYAALRFRAKRWE
jgi:hypothetical protein